MAIRVGFRSVSTEAPYRPQNTACDEDRYRILSVT